MRGPVLLPGDGGYDEARTISNHAVDHRPALVVRCTSTAEVQIVVRVARSHGLPLSVRVGGHDFFGRAVRPGGVLIDLRGLHAVVVNPVTRVATVGGGAFSGDLAWAAARHGLAAVLGTVSLVGVAGLTMAGGYSPLSPRYGLSLDNLLAAEVVLADGTVLQVDESHDADLYWALRGGGGNFGVVTSMRIRLHPVPSVLSGPILFPWDQAEAVLQRHAEFAAEAPDELGMVGGIVPGPDGRPALALTPVWSGDPETGERVLAQVAALGKPVVEQVRTMTFPETFAPADARARVAGRRYAIRTRSLAKLGPDAVATLVAAGSDRTSPSSVISWQYLRGAATRVPVEATAFAQRTDHFMLQILPGWDTDDGARHVAWAEDLSDALAPHALPGGYPNHLVPEMREQTAEAYGPNLRRLQQVKRRYDPDGVFTATPIPA